MKEPVIVQDNVRDKIQLDDKHNFVANVTIGLVEHGDFCLTIDFVELTMDDLQTLAQLTKLQRSIPIKSEIIKKEQYNISHIVIEKFNATSNISMTWECLSDDSDLYNSLSNPK